MKVLYITASSKEDSISTSKQVGNEFVKNLSDTYNCEITRLDLYNEYLPLPKAKYFTSRASLVSDADYDSLTDEEKKDVNRMQQLCDEFLLADVCIIATPMWSISFPSILKQYIDCITLNEELISIMPDQVKGLLDDKKRAMIYIQSSGGDYPMLLSRMTNHGLTYMKDLFTYLGIKTFIPILVEGTEQNGIGIEKAVIKAKEKFDDTIKKLSSIEDAK